MYLLLLPVWFQSLGLLAWATGSCAGIIYNLFDPLVSITPDGRTIAVAVAASEQSGFGGQIHSLNLKIDTITYAFPMLLALVLVTKASSLLVKLRAFAIGALAMSAATVLAVMFWAKMTSLQLQDRIALTVGTGAGDQSNFFYYAFHGYAFSQPVLAVGVWMALLTLGLFRGKSQDKDVSLPATRRNAPCPCGSGRKYKRCCGRTAA